MPRTVNAICINQSEPCILSHFHKEPTPILAATDGECFRPIREISKVSPACVCPDGQEKEKGYKKVLMIINDLL